MGLMSIINQYKQVIVIIGLLVGVASTSGFLPSELLGMSVGTTKLFCSVIILLCALVFLRFYRPKRRMPVRRPSDYRLPEIRREERPVSPDVRREETPIKKEEDVRVPPRDKRKIYEGF